nr:ribonuclease H-like domain-containing protein [Tanacetum cinerariifolium]
MAFRIQQYLQHEHYTLWEVIEFGDSYEVPTNTTDTTDTTTITTTSGETGKFERWQFRIQQYLQHEHYTLWEVIEFGDSYEVPTNTTDTTDTTTITTTSGETGTKSGTTVTLNAEDMQKKKNDVKAKATLLLSLPDEHQLRFSKYKTARELWAAILKTFGGNEATKKTKKNLLKQQYGNFRAEGSETLEQTFSRLQKKTKPNSQNMAFISSTKHNSGNEEGNTACVPTASTNVPTASASVATISQDTACAYIVSQSSVKKISIQGSDVAGFDKSKVKCFNCHKMGHFARECRAPKSQDRGRRDNFKQGSKAKEQAPKALMAIALLSMRANKFWKRTVKKISIQGSDVAGFDKSKVKCFNCHKMGHFARECRAPKSQDRGRRDNFKQGSKAKEQAPKALMAIDRVGWD